MSTVCPGKPCYRKRLAFVDLLIEERYDLEKLLQQSDEARAEAGEKTSKEDLENSSEEYSDTSATPETLLSRLPCHESKEGVIQTEVVELGRETPGSSSQSEIQQGMLHTVFHIRKRTSQD